MDKLPFDPAGLIVAERDGKLVGWAHAGFGPADPDGPSRRLDYEMGAVAMVVVDPAHEDPEMEQNLVLTAERYLRSRGAKVLYAGGQYPLNPFYWGLYGGSEDSGVLSSHLAFRRVVERMGYEPVAATALCELELSRWTERRDPKSMYLRKFSSLVMVEDLLLPSWWDSLALQDYRPNRFELIDRTASTRIGGATSWDMTAFSRDGQSRFALIDMEVEPSHRRKGYGRLLVSEILRHARAQRADVVTVQTSSTNTGALALYQGAGFLPVETATLYRLPGHIGPR